MSPESLTKSPKTINVKAADMWSFAVLLWELSAREMPFADLSPMEAGMKVSLLYYCFTKSAIYQHYLAYDRQTDFYFILLPILLQIATEGLRIEISPGISNHMAKFVRICMNEDPGKRPSFEQVLPILDKMKK